MRPVGGLTHDIHIDSLPLLSTTDHHAMLPAGSAVGG
jgi:hypothetical protein